MYLSDTYYYVLLAITAITQPVILVGSLVALVQGIRMKADNRYQWIRPLLIATIHLILGGVILVTEGFYADRFASMVWVAMLTPVLSILARYKLSDSMTSLYVVLSFLHALALAVLLFSL